MPVTPNIIHTANQMVNAKVVTKRTETLLHFGIGAPLNDNVLGYVTV
jgi:hypothetical protein